MLPFKIGDKTLNPLFWVPENLVRINKWKKPFSIWDELAYCRTSIDLETETDAILAHLKHPKLIYCPILRVQEMRKSHFCCAISPRNIRNQWQNSNSS
jgi:hypothetical protein